MLADALLDDLVGPLEQRLRDGEPERLGGLEVDDQLELGGLLDGRIAGLRPREDPIHFPGNSSFWVANPVAFPPGRARLATRPSLTGSVMIGMTIGIAVVACLAATAAWLLATMTSTLRRTKSAARPGRRSSLPSAHRYSMLTFRPST